MTVKSMFDYRFPAEHVAQGYTIAQGIGADMIPLAGYLDYGIVRDAMNPGNVMVNTHRESEKAAWRCSTAIAITIRSSVRRT